MNNRFDSKRITMGAVVGALYVIFTLISNAFGLSNGPIQVRISEALCIMPIYSFEAVPGLFIGCLFSNIITGANFFDVIFGSLATLIGAIFTYRLRKHKYLALLPPILSNTIIIPLLLVYAYHLNKAFLYFVITIGLGEIVSVGILGLLLMKLLNRTHIYTLK